MVIYLQIWKQSLQPLTLNTLFHDLINVYFRRSGADNPRGQNFDVNRSILTLRSFVASLKKKISLKSDFIQFFHDFVQVYSPGQRQIAPHGTKCWCQQKCLVTLFICCKFKTMSLKSDFIHFFHASIHIYSPGAEADSPQGQKCLITLPICCKFQRNLFEVKFYTIFFHDLIHAYSPGAGGIQPPGSKVLMWTETSGHFGHLLLVSNQRQWQFHCF